MKLCPTCLYCYEDEVLSCLEELHEPLIAPRLGFCTIAEKYRLVKRLGFGGMGAVYEGTHLELNRPLAIKILNPEYVSADPQARWRLRQEALTACNFDHPNLVRLYDFGTNVVSVEEQGRVHAYDELYIVMELLRGQSLKEVLAETTHLELPRAVAIAIQIAEGLAEIHSKGIIYRDLKPANVLICSDYKGDLLVKIVDFGAVKLRHRSSNSGPLDLTKAMFVGSPLYASPENCKGDPLDERSDIYGLGLVLYEMIAGRRAFPEGDFLTLLNSHAYETPAPLTTIPHNLADVTMRALRKNPNERPQTAKEFVESLRALDLGNLSVRPSDSFRDSATVGMIAKSAKDNEETVLRSRNRATRFFLSAKVKVDRGTQPAEFTKVNIPTARSLRAFTPIRMIAATAVVLGTLAQGGSLSRPRNTAPSIDLVIPPLVEKNKLPVPMPESTENRPRMEQRSLIKSDFRIPLTPIVRLKNPEPPKSERDASRPPKKEPKRADSRERGRNGGTGSAKSNKRTGKGKVADKDSKRGGRKQDIKPQSKQKNRSGGRDRRRY